jgi:hypothetical protein
MHGPLNVKNLPLKFISAQLTYPNVLYGIFWYFPPSFVGRSKVVNAMKLCD